MRRDLASRGTIRTCYLPWSTTKSSNMAMYHQLTLCLLMTASVLAQHEDTPRTFYDARRGADQGGMQYYYVPQHMYFNGRQQEMTYAQDPFFSYNGELPIPFSQDIFKPIPARKPQSNPNEGVNPSPYSEPNPVPEGEQAPYYIIPTEIELPDKPIPIQVSSNPSPSLEDAAFGAETAEPSSNSTESLGESEDRNSTNADSLNVPATTLSPSGNGLNVRNSPLKNRPYFTNAHHYPFPMGMKNEYKLQYQAIFPDAPLPEQENFSPMVNLGSIPDNPNQFMWLNPYSKKPGNNQPGFIDYDPTMLINAQQQQQKPQLIYYFFNPQGLSQAQASIPDTKQQQQTFNSQPSSPVYMLFQPSDDESFNAGPQSDKPLSSISGRGGQSGQYVEVPLSFMSNPSSQPQNRFYYVRPDVNRHFNDRV